MKFASYILFLVINKQKLNLFSFLTRMSSDLSKYLNGKLGIFLNKKQQKRS